jgi:zinc/manganese transport system substrate-binding protein
MPTSWRQGLARLAMVVAALAGAGPAAALTVFACEPEWAALTRVLWPEARVHVATHVGQDPHHIEARPALIAQLRQADLVVCTGGELEAGWLPVLQQRSGNPRAQDVFFAADHVKLIDPQSAAVGSPWAGDVHAHGNPHLHLDPRNLLPVVDALAARLRTVLPGQQAVLEQRRQAFAQRWRAQVAQWSEQAAPLRGKTVVVQHATFGYLWHWLGMRPVADLEPKPGLAPTPVHLQRLLETLKPKPPMAVVLAIHQDARAGRWLSGQLGPSVPVLTLPATLPEEADGAALERWMQTLLSSLLQLATAR